MGKKYMSETIAKGIFTIFAVVAIVAIIAGIVILMKLSDKNKFLGFIPGVLCLIIGLFILSTGASLYTILVGIAPTLIGYLVLTIQLNAAIRDFTPPEKAGLFQGIRMIFFVLIPMLVGPQIGKWVCQVAGAGSYVDQSTGLTQAEPCAEMFLAAGIVAVFVFIPLVDFQNLLCYPISSWIFL